MVHPGEGVERGGPTGRRWHIAPWMRDWWRTNSSRVPGSDYEGRDTSYQGRFEYGADRYGLVVDHLLVEDNFLPEVGFLRRDNSGAASLSGRFSPRPQSVESVGSSIPRRASTTS